MPREIIERIRKGDQLIIFGDKKCQRGTHQVDYLVTETLTNTDWFIEKKDWKTRQVSLSLNLDKAKEIKDILEEYIAYMENKE